ncbi:hypothetical protein DOTSEDRAFT_25568 [Dothistroma septosporum NZE10]|uniref:Uncharacterized protein n=1 Tax=Dothistroma septosporum (strain NZE10 / CBS 128990) TaxID=675120 RepID=M2YNP5_DOTSN|nr:hypothetical protein DOTSEDRAFT_25568 [Dothistroma septosporum NZE10]
MTPLFQIQDSTGKGQALFATQDILAETIIFQEAPVLTVPKSLPTEADMYQVFLQRSYVPHSRFFQVNPLPYPPAKRNKTNSTPSTKAPAPNKSRLDRIYFEKTFEREGACWICLTGSEINDSSACAPNATLIGNSALDEETLHASQDIQNRR